MAEVVKLIPGKDAILCLLGREELTTLLYVTTTMPTSMESLRDIFNLRVSYMLVSHIFLV